MIRALTILTILYIFTGCGESHKTLSDYEKVRIKVAKQKHTAANNEFTILLPKDWHINEDPVDSTVLLYTLETGSKDSSLTALIIHKLVLPFSSENALDSAYAGCEKQISNLAFIEKVSFNNGEFVLDGIHTGYLKDDKVINEEFDFFIPTGKNEVYNVILVSSKDENIDHNFGLLLECVRSFRFIK